MNILKGFIQYINVSIFIIQTMLFWFTMNVVLLFLLYNVNIDWFIWVQFSAFQTPGKNGDFPGITVLSDNDVIYTLIGLSHRHNTTVW